MRAADLLHKSVIASAAADRALGSDALRGDLKHGLGIVVQPAHQPRIDQIVQAHAIQQGQQRALVVAAFVA
ncbi:hypothetical protein SDC9_156556 [bioreactor metagenome]|uniref:Uncharacterized protein n=1 Tax=bioreactor metagenome TaxID=1076179 RepID=A0A645F507_9ZZZZ